MTFRQRVRRLLDPPKLAYWNLALCAVAVWANTYYQAFCRPVTWATIALVVAFTPVVLHPLLRAHAERWRVPIHFLFGIAACICVYCILFIGLMNLGALLGLLGHPILLLLYLPHFLLWQILIHRRRTPDPSARRAFRSGIALCLTVAIGAGIWFRVEHPSVEAALSDPERSSSIRPSYMTERMLGMHFKYHTALNLFDGWRPPLHDPLIVTAIWLNYPLMDSPTAREFRRTLLRGGGPFFVMGPWRIDKRIAVYKRVFPGRPIRQSCSCAKEYGEVYANDPRIQ